MKQEKITIIRTAAGFRGSVGLIEALKKHNVRVVGTDIEAGSAGLHFCDKSYVVPKGDDPQFIEAIIRIIKKEKANAIISGPEEELINLSAHKKEIETLGCLLLAPDYDSVIVCADKVKTAEFFQKIGIPAPNIFENTELANFPCIVKPRFGRGSAGVFKAVDKAELAFYVKQVEHPIVQQFVLGEEYTVDIFSDLQGEVLSVVPRLRLKVDLGISIKAKTVFDKEIIAYCKKIAETLKLIGPSCIQCIKNESGVYFLEINPRFGGGSILSVKADPNIISNLLRIIRGEKPMKSHGFTRGLTMLRYYSEVYTEKI